MKICAALLFALCVAFPARAMDVALPFDGSDASPAFNDAVDQLCAASSHDRTMRLPAGVFSFYTPTRTITCALSIVGQGKGSTRVIRRYQGGVFFYWTRGTDQSGGSIKDMNIEAGGGTTNGIAVYVQALPDPDLNNNSLNRHSFVVDNVLIGREAAPGATTSWYVGIYLDGSQNPVNAQGTAPGIRATFITRTTISGTNQGCLYANNATGAHAQIECYSLGGAFSTYIILRGAVTDSLILDCRSACIPYWADSLARGLIYNGVATGPQ